MSPVRCTTRIKSACWLLVVSCVMLSVSTAALRQLLADLTSTAPPPLSLLLVRLAWVANALTFTSVVLFHLNPSTWKARFSQAVQLDWILLVFMWIPPGLLLTRLNTPSMQHPSWAGHFSFLLVAAAAVDISPAHSLVQLLAMLPFLTMLELYDTCSLSKAMANPAACMPALLDVPHSPGYLLPPPLPGSSGINTTSATAAPCAPWAASMTQLLSQCSSEGQLSTYLLTRLPISIAYLALAVIIPFIAYTYQHHQVLSSDAEAKGSTAAAQQQHPLPPPAQPLPLPLHSLGLPLVSTTGLRGPLLSTVRAMELLAGLLSRRLLIWLVCIPLGVYYVALTALSRHQLLGKREISADEWLVVMAVFFTLGRESCQLDFLPFFAQSQSHLRAATAVLSDLLPGHIVSTLLQQHNQSIPPPPPLPPLHRASTTSLAEAPPAAVERCSPRPLADAAWPQPWGLDPTPAVSRASSVATVPESQPLDPLHEPSDTPLHVAPASPLSMLRRSGAPYRTSSCRMLGSSISGSMSSPFRVFMRRIPSAHGSLMQLAGGQDQDQVSGLLPCGEARAPTLSEAGACLSSAGPEAPTPPQKLSEAHDCVTIFFSDIVGFSSWAHELPPAQVMDTLNDLYSRLDDIIIQELPSLYKVETIGDAYMVAGNLLFPNPAHAANMVRFALRAQQEAAKVPRPDLDDGTALQLRIGLHSGPATSGVVGKLRRRFCIFGDTVNMASRTEGSCPEGCVQVSAATHTLALQHLYDEEEVVFRDRGEVELKGAARPTRMYLAEPTQPLLLTELM